MPFNVKLSPLVSISGVPFSITTAQFMSVGIIILMTAQSKSHSVTALEFWDGDESPERV